MSKRSLARDGDLALTEYLFCDDGKFAKVYVQHEGVGGLGADAVTWAFGPAHFELRIASSPSSALYLCVPNLCYPILQNKSAVVVKANKVIVKLHKKDLADAWNELTDEKVKAEVARQRRVKSGELKNADTMDLIKDMYENADEEGKKSLAQAWETGNEKRNASRMGW